MLEFSRIIHQQIWRDILVEAETPIQDLKREKESNDAGDKLKIRAWTACMPSC